MAMMRACMHGMPPLLRRVCVCILNIDLGALVVDQLCTYTNIRSVFCCVRGTSVCLSVDDVGWFALISTLALTLGTLFRNACAQFWNTHHIKPKPKSNRAAG